jgi:hypothetical protein
MTPDERAQDALDLVARARARLAEYRQTIEPHLRVREHGIASPFVDYVGWCFALLPQRARCTSSAPDGG